MIKECPFCKYYDSGIIEVFGNKEGYPRYTGVCPAPDVNTKPEDRQKRYDDAINGITLQGYLITYQKFIRNTAFDKKGQKTTLKIKYRPCKNRTEINQVYSKICKILDRNVEEYIGISCGDVPI